MDSVCVELCVLMIWKFSEHGHRLRIFVLFSRIRCVALDDTARLQRADDKTKLSQTDCAHKRQYAHEMPGSFALCSRAVQGPKYRYPGGFAAQTIFHTTL